MTGRWRLPYQAFGAKPKRTRPSVEALLRRVEGGLPRIDRLTDIYNAISVRHLLPVGGEDLADKLTALHPGARLSWRQIGAAPEYPKCATTASAPPRSAGLAISFRNSSSSCSNR
jgi:B3/4 domain-containing protein